MGGWRRVTSAVRRRTAAYADRRFVRRFEVVDVVSAWWPPQSMHQGEVIVTYRIRRADEASPRPATSLPRRAAHWAGPYDPGFVIERGPGDVRYRSPGWRPPPPERSGGTPPSV